MLRRDDLFLSSRASAHKGGEIIEYKKDNHIIFSSLFTVKLFLPLSHYFSTNLSDVALVYLFLTAYRCYQ